MPNKVHLIFIKVQTMSNLTQIPDWLDFSESEYENFLTDQYNYFVTTEGNKVWSCSMSLAWNEMKRNFLDG